MSDDYLFLQMGHSIHMNAAWFQQYGARPHTSSDVFHFPHELFEE